MTQLAIKGHPTRGKEVIQLLEMLGGKNIYKLDGKKDLWYILSNSTIKHATYCFDERSFTLEEFEEKYPYKVGDKVKAWVNGYCGVFNIQDITWDSIAKEVKYRIHDYWHSVENLQPFKEETVEEEKENFVGCIEKTIQECLFGKEGATKEIKIDIPEGYEFFGIDDNNKVVLTKIQPQYPKTYEECCQVLMGKTDFQDFELVLTRYTITRSGENSISLCPPHISLINNFYKLLICRDAYWKIAGEEMRLDKSWKPDWEESDGGYRYCIRNQSNKIVLSNIYLGENYILSFPTAEIRDAFFENFKDLINEVKELL